MSDLAIVIPAYKALFFESALASLASQTCKEFSVYIGDDNSPEDLRPIVDRYLSSMSISYTKFPNNIGSKNIVSQWKRCVDLTKDEKWIWLFSDDDLVDINAVEMFYRTVGRDEPAFDVFRFNTTQIDREGNITDESPTGPLQESSLEMAYNLLLGRRGNSMPDHIFSRQVYKKYNGFVETEYAQAADWATSILFSSDKGIRIIPEARMHWRKSGINISSLAGDKATRMVNGHLQFVEWTLNHFSYLKTNAADIDFEMIKRALVVNIRNVLIYHYKGFHGSRSALITTYRNKMGLNWLDIFKELNLIQRNVNSSYNNVIGLLNKFLKR